MASFANNAEGGTAGATVTLANSGGASGDALDSVVIEAAATLTYEAAAAYRGNLGYWARGNAATNARVHVGYRAGVNLARMRWRGMINLRQYLGVQFIQFLGTGGTAAGIFGYIQLDSTGHLFVIDSGGLNHGTKSQPAIPQNTWVRLDVILEPSTTATSADGRFSFRVYDGDSLTPLITYDVTTANTALNCTGWNFVKTNLSGFWTTTGGVYFDELATDDLSSVDFIGPVPSPTVDDFRLGDGTVLLRAGDAAVDRVYLGDGLVWP